MPRDGNGVATKPAGTTATPNQLIESSKFNSVIDDIYALLNAALPITSGGTSAVSKQGAVSALFDGTTIVDDDNFTLAANGDQTKLVGFDLSGLTTATTRTWTAPDKNGTVALTSDLTPLGTKVDTRRNRVVNGDMRVSQENGTTSGTTNGRYPVDQWAQYFVTSAGTLTVAQVASVTPAGSPNRIRATVTVADGTLAAGEYWTLSQNLEGSNVADFQYGGAAAKASVLRFGFKGPAGTYAVHLGNSAANRSFVALFTIAGGDANVDTVQTIAIPGDTSGTWLTADGVIGITLEIVLACGTTFQGAAGWQSGNILGTSAVSNGMGTGSAVFELFDVGLRLDPDATGVYGAYEVGETDAVYRAERYGRRFTNYLMGTANSGPRLQGGGILTSAVGRFAVIPTLTAGATTSASSGNNGAPAVDPLTTATTDFIAVYNNSGLGWTVNALVTFSGFISARLS